MSFNKLGTNAKDPKTEKRMKGNGGFFAVEKPIILNLITEYGNNAGAAYIVLARFTDADNKHTLAGVKAIEKNTGIGRTRARKILKEYLAGIIVKTGGTTRQPRRTLKAYADIERIGRHHNSFFDAEMTERQREVYDLVGAGGTPRKADKAVANTLVTKGWLDEHNGYYNIKVDIEEGPDREMIWLPNEFVDGASGEVSPLELLRQTRDTMAFRLYLVLAFHHDLPGHGGVNRNLVCGISFRQKIWEYGEFDIYAFWLPNYHSYNPEHPDLQFLNPHTSFWASFGLLETLGLLDWVWQLTEDNDNDAALIHPYVAAHAASGEEPEKRCGQYSERIALLMMGSEERDYPTEGNWPDKEGHFNIYDSKLYEGWNDFVKMYRKDFEENCYRDQPREYIAIPRHYSKATLTKVARLKYRPNTLATKKWWSGINQGAKDLCAKLEELREVKCQV